ncbi:MAG: acyltransferase [Clostridium sp.]|nr:acyltransferase [Clostridium sp.]
MKFKRYLCSLRLLTIINGYKRGDYLRKKKVFKKIGKDVCIQLYKVPLYPEKISIGSHVVIGAGVVFCTHDIISCAFPKSGLGEKTGLISLGDNVFIGANSIIMYNCNIENEVIVAAGSVVCKNIPRGQVWGGNPARYICDTKDFIEKRKGRE